MSLFVVGPPGVEKLARFGESRDGLEKLRHPGETDAPRLCARGDEYYGASALDHVPQNFYTSNPMKNWVLYRRQEPL